VLTAANVNETEVADRLIAACADAPAVYADKACDTHARRAMLKRLGLADSIQFRANKHHALSPAAVERNVALGRVRGRVETVFAVIKRRDRLGVTGWAGRAMLAGSRSRCSSPWPPSRSTCAARSVCTARPEVVRRMTASLPQASPPPSGRRCRRKHQAKHTKTTPIAPLRNSPDSGRGLGEGGPNPEHHPTHTNHHAPNATALPTSRA
jgi:hypothetical protein